MSDNGKGRGAFHDAPTHRPPRYNPPPATTLPPDPVAREAIECAAHAAHERARALDVRRIAARELDALDPSPVRAAPRPSTFSLTPAAARAEFERLTTTGGVDGEPWCPWTPGEVARVLAAPGGRS